MIPVLLIFSGVYFLMVIAFIFLWLTLKNKRAVATGDIPLVSILVAARNEEQNILRTLQSLDRLNYPKDKLQILIGDDHSDDKTAAIVQTFIRDKPYFTLYSGEKATHGDGKAKVLEKLANEAKGDYLFITDADIAVPGGWVKHMLKWFDKGVGIVTGFTTVKGNSWFHHLQAIDWCYAIGVVSILAKFKLPVSAMGNNMAISKEAYWSVGGYANIPFSITEDYALFKAVIDKGWGFVNLANHEVKAVSRPIMSFSELMHQRKRWMHGAVQLPWYAFLIPVMQALFYITALVLLVTAPMMGLTVWGAKILLQSILILLELKRTKELHLAGWVIFYDFYAALVSLAMFLFYLSPAKIKWKGRVYGRK